MQNVNYSFVNSDDKGTLVFRSSVNSFGLDHVSDKDVVSFYTNFSKYSYMDTGLLPVIGSGLLSIRSAGEHTQIAYQHAPGMYYINWGDYEGDRSATKYYVAQPYRIVIADLVNGNLLGARTFYSPVPITYPALPLYHVNLPNINCRGYRGNGVGWICLYHSEDISQYPFNEKLVRILDRCSGTEAYNDQNMSETDGPRFYCSHNKPEYIYNPSLWASKSEKEGFEWILDPDLLIPVLVKDLDHQDKHYEDGQPLTFVDALFGNYQAYYVDNLIPKPVNSIARNDLQIKSSDVFGWFKHAYNFSSSNFNAIDTFSASTQLKISTSSTIFDSSENDDEEENDENIITCYRCDCAINVEFEDYINVFPNNQVICSDCCSDSTVWVEHLSAYCWDDDNTVMGLNEFYYHVDHWGDMKFCGGCNAPHPFDDIRNLPASSLNVWNIFGGSIGCCSDCISMMTFDVAPEITDNSHHACAKCNTSIPNIYALGQVEDNLFKVKLIKNIISDSEYKIVGVCNTCYDKYCTPIEKDLDNEIKNFICICGSSVTPDSVVEVNLSEFALEKSTSTVQEIALANQKLYENNYHTNKALFDSSDGTITHVTLTHVCSKCSVEIGISTKDYIESASYNLVQQIINESIFTQKLETFYGVKFNLSYEF